MRQRLAAVPRWAVAMLAGLMSASLCFALFRFGLGFDAGLAAFFAGGIGLCAAFLVVRWFAAAAIAMGVMEAMVSALAAIVSILAAVFGALS
jgi:hypothetical protein